jgi:PAS domain S-box-containing protein
MVGLDVVPTRKNDPPNRNDPSKGGRTASTVAPMAAHAAVTPAAAELLRDPAAISALLTALVESSDDAIVAKDLNGTILSWNVAAERIFGWTAEEAIGRSILLVIPEDRRHEEDAILATMRRGERIDHFETERVRKDGRRIMASVSISPIRDATGTVIGVAKIARDITATRQAQTAQATLAAIVESSDDAIIGTMLDGSIVSWNAGAGRMFDYTADEIIGRSILTLVPPERHPEDERILSAICRGERIGHFETERVSKDGRIIPVSLSVSPIKDANDVTVGAAKIARDISVRRGLERERDAVLERERTARAEAEAANRAKDAFLATISHELRTPLSPILAWSRMIRDGTLGADKVARGIAAIERSGHALTQLINDLLDVSRIITGKLRIDVRPIDLGAVVQAAVEVVRPAADAKDIHLVATVDAGAGRIVGDADRLQQVVWNLVSNAIKFTPSGGRVMLRVQDEGPRVCILVEDTGQGFAADFAPHLFDRFRQADNSITRQHGGLGLGLAIVRHIVELHGGTVRGESPGLDRGATFTVVLPRKAAPPSTRDDGDAIVPAAGPTEQHARLAGARVLVVDDEPDSNDVVSTILAVHGAEVRVASSVPRALEVLKGWRPDLVITDIGMPDHDGMTLLAAMRRDGSLARIPAIALTAYATREDRVRILGAGFLMHLAKPIAGDELVASVLSVMTTLGKR